MSFIVFKRNSHKIKDKGQRLNPREWFVVPFEAIEQAIQLILNENIIHYEYDPSQEKVILKG